MNSTDSTPAPAAGGRQVGQLLAARYRLGLFKGGDDIADVWHALDESTELVVTLEILRDRENEPARQRFLAEARRMAAIERPSVMRVASIHSEAAATFIVFEHLIPLPVVLTGLTGVAKDTRPATKLAAERTFEPFPFAPQAPAGIVMSPLASVAGPTRSGATPDVTDQTAVPASAGYETAAPASAAWETAVSGSAAWETAAPAVVDLDAAPLPVPATPPRLPETPPAASTAAAAARSDVSGLAQDLVADVRGAVRDAGLSELVAAARAHIPRGLDTLLLGPLSARVTTVVSRIAAPLHSVRRVASQIAAALSLVGRVASRIAAPLHSVGRVASRTAAPRRSVGRAVPKARPASPRAAEPAKRETAHDGATLPTITAKVGGVLPVALSLATRVGSAARWLLGRLRPLVLVVLAGAVGVLIFVAFQLLPLDDVLASALRALQGSSPAATASPAPLAPAPFELPPLSAYSAAFEAQAPYPKAAPNATVEWVVALRNTGSVGWYRGIDGAQAALALQDGTGVAVQSTPYVAPGQIGWFVVRFRARAELGPYTVPLLPRIDGQGQLPDLGIYAVVTVAKSP